MTQNDPCRDPVLRDYRQSLIQETGLEFPYFAEEASHKAKILAVLLYPGNSGAERSRVCSIDNDDPSARNQTEALHCAHIPRESVVFWNFYAGFYSFNPYKSSFKKTKNRICEMNYEQFLDIIKNMQRADYRKFWAKLLLDIVEQMPNLKVIAICGNEAQAGWQTCVQDDSCHIDNQAIKIICTPHPSAQAIGHSFDTKNAKKWRRRKQLFDDWKRAAHIAGFV